MKFKLMESQLIDNPQVAFSNWAIKMDTIITPVGNLDNQALPNTNWYLGNLKLKFLPYELASQVCYPKQGHHKQIILIHPKWVS